MLTLFDVTVTVGIAHVGWDGAGMGSVGVSEPRDGTDGGRETVTQLVEVVIIVDDDEVIGVAI